MFHDAGLGFGICVFAVYISVYQSSGKFNGSNEVSTIETSVGDVRLFTGKPSLVK